MRENPSFGEMQSQYSSVAQALSSHCARACEKARKQNLMAQRIYVFVRSNPFRQDLEQYSKSIECRLVNPTDDTRIITKVAKLCLKKLFKQGIQYKKVGVMLENLINKASIQLDLFHQPSDEALIKKDQLMLLFDTINDRFGSHTIKLAAEGYCKPWAMRAQMRSPCYTTRWSELPVVHNHT